MSTIINFAIHVGESQRKNYVFEMCIGTHVICPAIFTYYIIYVNVEKITEDIKKLLSPSVAKYIKRTKTNFVSQIGKRFPVGNIVCKSWYNIKPEHQVAVIIMNQNSYNYNINTILSNNKLWNITYNINVQINQFWFFGFVQLLWKLRKTSKMTFSISGLKSKETKKVGA